MTPYDPHDPTYHDEKSVRDELTRVFDVCHGCRSCVELCSSFPKLFELLDGVADGDAGRLTLAEQDVVVDRCFQCKRCATECPYTPARHELTIDVPRLMLRSVAMRRRTGQLPARGRVTANVLGRSDFFGRLGASGAPLVARSLAAKPGSFLRRLLSSVTGVTAVRELTPFASQRFSIWFGERTSGTPEGPNADAIVFATCLIEYQDPAVGRDLVGVYEQHGIECTVSGAGCCGAPWQHAGDVERFTRIAERNVSVLAAEIRAGGRVVVPQPTCGYVIRHDYVDYVDPSSRDDAELVARNTFDAVEFLARQHLAAGAVPATDALRSTPATVTYHVSGHLDALGIGYPARDLLERAGAEVQLVRQSSGAESLWELRSANDSNAHTSVDRLVTGIERTHGDVVIGDCQLSNAQSAARIGRPVAHPIQLIASVCGISDEESGPSP